MSEPPVYLIIQRRKEKLLAAKSCADTAARIQELSHVLSLLESAGYVPNYEPAKVLGLNDRRTKDNPDERRLAKAWRSTPACMGDRLAQILDNRTGGWQPPPVTLRDRQVAASVIQWLGSPVGLPWLAESLGSKRLREMARHVAQE